MSPLGSINMVGQWKGVIFFYQPIVCIIISSTNYTSKLSFTPCKGYNFIPTYCVKVGHFTSLPSISHMSLEAIIILPIYIYNCAWWWGSWMMMGHSKTCSESNMLLKSSMLLFPISSWTSFQFSSSAANLKFQHKPKIFIFQDQAFVPLGQAVP